MNLRFFENISETLLTILTIFTPKVALSSVIHPVETVGQNYFLFSRYWRSKLDHSVGAINVFRDYLGNAPTDFAHIFPESSP